MSNTSIVEYIQTEEAQAHIKSVLGTKKDQFVTSVASIVNSNPKLKEADRKSLFSACLVSASLDLPVNQNLGFAYIIPYQDKKLGLVAQFQIGYKGFIQLAMRSGQFKTINVTDVRQSEIVDNNRLSGEITFDWISEDRDKLPVIGYVGYFKLTNGFEKTLYMTVDELNKHGHKYSKSMQKGYGLWKDEFDAMARKTVIKLLLSKYAPMSTEMAKAVEADQSTLNGDKPEYPDNKPLLPEEIANDKERERVIRHIENSKTIEELEQCIDAVPDDEVKDMYESKLSLLNKGVK